MKDVTYQSFGRLRYSFIEAAPEVVDEALDTLRAFDIEVPEEQATLPHSALTLLAERVITKERKALDVMKRTSSDRDDRLYAELALSLLNAPYKHEKYDINAWNASMEAVEIALSRKYPHLSFEKPAEVATPATEAAAASPTDLS